jgi:cytochrome c553
MVIEEHPLFRQHSVRGLILGLAALVVISPFAQAAGDITVLEKCQECHSKDGLSRMPYIPNLAGQKDFYLVQSLMAYKAGERKSHDMAEAVKGLSDEDLANVAAYYAAIKITVEVPK